MDTTTSQVIKLDLNNLSLEDIKWLHDLKNKAQAMTGRLQLKHALEMDHDLAA